MHEPVLLKNIFCKRRTQTYLFLETAVTESADEDMVVAFYPDGCCVWQAVSRKKVSDLLSYAPYA